MRDVHIRCVAPKTAPDLLLATLRPGDVLLVEAHIWFSTAIKFLAQLTWSRAEALREGGLGVVEVGRRVASCPIACRCTSPRNTRVSATGHRPWWLYALTVAVLTVSVTNPRVRQCTVYQP